MASASKVPAQIARVFRDRQELNARTNAVPLPLQGACQHPIGSERAACFPRVGAAQALGGREGQHANVRQLVQPTDDDVGETELEQLTVGTIRQTSKRKDRHGRGTAPGRQAPLPACRTNP